jgi:hypothetical protein
MVVLNRVIQQAAYQSVGGMLIGSSIDSFFPKSESVTSSNAMKVAAEALAEIVLLSGVTATFLNWVNARIPGEDPTMKIAFTATLLTSTPNLTEKLQHLSSYIGETIGSHYMGERVPTSNTPSQPGYIYANQSPLNPDVPSITGGEENLPFGSD